MRLRLTPLLGLALLTLDSCERENLNADQLQAQHSSLSEASIKSKRSLAALRSEVQRAQESRSTTSANVDESRAAVAKAEKDLRLLQLEFDQYKKDYRNSILRRSPGMDLGELTVGGKAYHSVKVREVDQWELSVIHAGGMARFALSDLPSELKNLFAYDPNAGMKPVKPGSDLVVNLPVRAATTPATNTGGQSPLAPVSSADSTTDEPSPTDSGYSVSGRRLGKIGKSSNGRSVEVLSSFGTSGSKVTGAKATVPQGYKPIGSNYSGSAMDKNKKP